MELEARASGEGAQAIIDFLRGTWLPSSSPTGLRAMAEMLLHLPGPDSGPGPAWIRSRNMLVLYGENDDAWDPATEEDMAAPPRAQRVCIPAAAHSPAVEVPETTRAP